MAGASVDDVFVIVMFTAFTGLAQGGSISPISFVKIPVSILIGSFIGLAAGWGLAVYFKRVHIRDTVKVIVLLCVSFILVTLEDRYSDIVPFSSLISVMGIGIALQKKREEAARRLSVKFNKVWVCAEIMLFVLVGGNCKHPLCIERRRVGCDTDIRRAGFQDGWRVLLPGRDQA